MGESCVQGLVRLTVVGAFPFSNFHETTEQTKMASLIRHYSGRWLCQNDLESPLVSWKKLHVTHSQMRFLPCASLMSVCQGEEEEIYTRTNFRLEHIQRFNQS